MGTIMYKGSEAPIMYRGQKSPIMYEGEEYNSGAYWPFKPEYEILYQEKYGLNRNGERAYYKHSNLGKAIVAGVRFEYGYNIFGHPLILISDIESEVYFDVIQGTTKWQNYTAEPILIDGHQFYHSIANYADTKENTSIPNNSIIQVGNGTIYHSFDEALQAFINEAHV